MLKKLLYEIQYFSYLNKLPFYCVREFGVKKLYKSASIDKVIKKYGFSRRFSPIEYAMLCRSTDYEKASEQFFPYPSREYIRKKIAKKLKHNSTDFDLYDLMNFSTFKSNWRSEGGGEEYWEYMSEIESKFRS